MIFSERSWIPREGEWNYSAWRVSPVIGRSDSDLEWQAGCEAILRLFVVSDRKVTLDSIETRNAIKVSCFGWD
jgi:hypothetical protein